MSNCTGPGSPREGAAVSSAMWAFCAIGWALSLFSICKFLHRFQTIQKMERKQNENNEAQLDKAIDTLHSIKFPVVLISVQRFIEIGRLKPHEELRDLGELAFYDSLEQLKRLPTPIIFLSHQWRACLTRP